MKNFWLSLSHPSPSSDRKERSIDLDEPFSARIFVSFSNRTRKATFPLDGSTATPKPRRLARRVNPCHHFRFPVGIGIGRHSTTKLSIVESGRKQIIGTDSKRWRRPCQGRPRLRRLWKRRIGDVACGSWWRTKCRNRSQPIVRTARWRKGSNTFSRTRRTSVERVYEPTRGTLGHEFLPKEQLVRRHVSVTVLLCHP